MGFRREYDESEDLYRCTGCGEWKAYESFYENGLYKYGIMARCKACHAAYHKARYESGKRRTAAAQAEVPQDYVTDEEIAALLGDAPES